MWGLNYFYQETIFISFLSYFSTHVLTEDTVSRDVKGKKLYSTRVISKTNKMPKWGEKIIPGGARPVCVVEESIVDVEKKTLTTYTRNVGLTKFMVRLKYSKVFFFLFCGLENW